MPGFVKENIVAVFFLFCMALIAGTAEAKSTPSCPTPGVFPDGIDVIKVTRIFTGPHGDSAFEDIVLKGQSKAYFRPGEIFTQNDLGAAKILRLVSGPPNVSLPPHRSPSKEMFLTIQGSSSVMLSNGQERILSPGSLVVFDDANSKTGHGGRTGPCGYISLQIVPADVVPK